MLSHDIYIGRQPIYDRSMNVFAYEILYRTGERGGASVTDGNMATSTVLQNAFLEIGLEKITDNKPGFFNFTREFILRQELELPKDLVVLEVLEDIVIDDAIVNAVKQLKARGYKIALDDFVFEKKWEPLLSLADVIKVEVPGIDKREILEKTRQLRPYKAKLLAEKVETHEEYELFMKMGFHYFQGYFFCKPRTISAKSISASKISTMRLLAKVQDPNVEIREMEAIIREDPSLTYKLLKYLRSPLFALRREITSIPQALAYLGLKTIRSWVTIITLAGVQDKTSELCTLALQRADRCENIAKALRLPDPDKLFLTGLFSLLDAMMDAEMETILKEMPLSDDVANALLKREGKSGQILDAVIEIERGNWDKAIVLGVPLQAIRDLSVESIIRAGEQMAAIQK